MTPSPDSTNKLPSPKAGTFDTSIKAWLQAMQKAQKIKPGGKLLFINQQTGQAVQ